ncbi:predicted protein [Scheffersomyces stipitis CBS 6054]|uniref:Uncharacterized protein n=1 Tax=Scheffersomyces stipitis (strain ATCC 58785 / CBS 6054 / NBRC 10063 / NRRL Y-11545) TaxID=322104 RepID=A3LTD4_PICST|nr:predicted protein [Scheffersomyces stipitis CBS 6054]ABN66054.2 predicted protein [Scheffersomyces stipitis CBS 6054]KAG2733283.1 hypothetical protein G9P44_004273 [Scheffersomyces stipitis]
MTLAHRIKKGALLLLILLFGTFSFYYLKSYDSLVQLQSSLAKQNFIPISHYPSSEPLVIFPKVYNHFTGNFTDLYHFQYTHDTVKPRNVVQYSGNSSTLSRRIVDQNFKQHPLIVFDSNNEQEECSKLKDSRIMEISAYEELDRSLEPMVTQLLYQLENDEAFFEMKDVFMKEIQRQQEEGILHKHFFKFGGTSVWLKEHGVHFMISRVVFSLKGFRNAAIVSLAYAQIFNDNWEEMKDVELIFPSRSPHSDEPIVYKSMKFPSFLPIPYYQNFDYRESRFYGPEDPRLLLVKNSLGHEEPLMVFNAFQRKINQTSLSEEGQMNVTFGFYRSMFLCWPFQFQTGKGDIEGVRNETTDHIVYNKIVELRRDNTQRLKKQKNWTPFIDLTERDDNYDKHIYFVYRWSSLEILKCKLTDFSKVGESQCLFVYKRETKQKDDIDVGSLRGGTELLQVDVGGHKAWVGFPRAHIKYCGCGRAMYRPNLAVLTQHGREYKISYVSSFISLDVKIIGWMNPDVECVEKDPSVMLPNGISSWETIGEVDYLTLTISVTDESNHIIQIKNLLEHIKQMTTTENPTLGFNDNAIDCAIKQSKNFCKKYGDSQRKMQKEKKLMEDNED